MPNGVPATTKQRLVGGLQRAVESRGRSLLSTTASLLSIFVIVLVLVRENNNALNLVKLSLFVNRVLFPFFKIFSQHVQRALMSLSFFFFLLPFILSYTELQMSTALKIWNDYKKLLVFVPFVFWVAKIDLRQKHASRQSIASSCLSLLTARIISVVGASVQCN